MNEFFQRRSRTILLLVVVFCLTTLIGYFSGSQSPAHQSQSPQGSASSSQTLRATVVDPWSSFEMPRGDGEPPAEPSPFELLKEMGYEDLAARLQAGEFEAVSDELEANWELGLDRQAVLILALQAWAEKDPVAAFEWTERNPFPGERSLLLKKVVERWAKDNPQEALQTAKGYREGRMRDALVATALTTWAKDDVDAPQKWILDLPEGPLRHEASMNFLIEVAGSQLPEAGRLFQEISSNERYAKIMTEFLVNEWAAVDPAGALEWTQSLPPGAAKDDALLRVSQAWAVMDPEAAIASLKLMHDQERVDLMAEWIATGWAQSDPEAALAWVSGLPRDLDRRNGTVGGIHFLAEAQPERAAAFLEGIEDEITKEYATFAVASQWAGQDPAGAMEWVMEMEDPVVRLDSSMQVTEEWVHKDISGFEEWRAGIEDPTWKKEISVNAAFQIAHADPVRATAWLMEIPDAGERDQALVGFLKKWKSFDGLEANEWLQSSDLPEESKAQIGADAEIHLYD